MVIEIDLFYLIIGLLCILGSIALIYLIITLIKLGKLIGNLNNFIDKNSNNLDSTVTNLKDITDNLKDVSDVVTETTAEAIVVKENLVENLNTFADIVSIIMGIFKGK
ncbi:MAG: hypothetical protein ACRC2K_00240 [Clostridium sp.]